MLARSIFSSYSRLLAGMSLAFLAITLAGCNDKAADATPPRPVLVATAHYEAETPERSFVGTIRPRIEADMGGLFVATFLTLLYLPGLYALWFRKSLGQSGANEPADLAPQHYGPVKPAIALAEAAE